MKLVFLEAESLGPDIDLSPFHELGHVTAYPRSDKEQVPERVKDADVVIVNKIPMNAETLGEAGNLKMIAVTATGTNNIHWDFVKERGITVANVAGYSTSAVAQHTFALLFYIFHKLNYYDRFVKEGGYCRCPGFTHFGERIYELEGKTWGIVGMGAIGRKVADIASVFGCNVQYASTTGRNLGQPYPRVELDALLRTSDIVSLHAPLTPATEGMMNEEAFAKMKSSAILVNVARGALVDQEALANALERGLIAGAALDVLTDEPMREDNPLLRIQDSRKLIVTPHIGWAPLETRERLMREVYENIAAFFRGEPRNVASDTVHSVHSTIRKSI